MKKLQTFKILVLIMVFLAVAAAGGSQGEARDFCDQGQKFLGAGEYLQAAEAYRQAIREQPGLEAAHLGLKRAYAGLTFGQQLSEAHRLLGHLAPNDAVGHYGLGLLYVQKRDLGYAEDEYRILQKLDPALAQRLYRAIYPRQ